MFHSSKVLLQWLRTHYPDSEKFMTQMGLTSLLGSLGMLRHQIQDVSKASGIPTSDLAKYTRLIYENLSRHHLAIVLFEINLNGIQDGHTPLCQVFDTDEPGTIVELVYVQDLIDKHNLNRYADVYSSR